LQLDWGDSGSLCGTEVRVRDQCPSVHIAHEFIKVVVVPIRFSTVNRPTMEFGATTEVLERRPLILPPLCNLLG
jgi:hypothetical protein